jgi:hypothetical protein
MAKCEKEHTRLLLYYDNMILVLLKLNFIKNVPYDAYIEVHIYNYKIEL